MIKILSAFTVLLIATTYSVVLSQDVFEDITTTTTETFLPGLPNRRRFLIAKRINISNINPPLPSSEQFENTQIFPLISGQVNGQEFVARTDLFQSQTISTPLEIQTSSIETNLASFPVLPTSKPVTKPKLELQDAQQFDIASLFETKTLNN